MDYITEKIKTKSFKSSFEDILAKLADKKIIIYGSENVYKLISKNFDFSGLNIVAFTDENIKNEKTFENYKIIPKEKIKDEIFDAVLILSDEYQLAEEILDCEINLSDEIPVYAALKECIDGEKTYFKHLEHWHFEENLIKLTKRLKNKKILLYGAGVFFETLNLYFDLSKLNIVGISDMKFKPAEGKEISDEFLGYKTYSPDDIKALKPDYILVSTQSTINILEALEKDLKGSKIKILPLVDKNFWQMLKEIWE